MNNGCLEADGMHLRWNANQTEMGKKKLETIRKKSDSIMHLVWMFTRNQRHGNSQQINIMS